MDKRHLQEMAELEEHYWWHAAKRRLVVELLRRFAPAAGLVVEGGVGSARNLVEFQRLGYDVEGYDVLPDAVAMAQSRGLSGVTVADLHEPWRQPASGVAAVVMLDVLEHMADPVRVLKNAAEVLQPDGAVILTVPAYQWLFGRWDEILGHYRRYTRRELRAHAAEAGLATVWCQHWNAFTLAPAVVKRTVERLVPRREAAEFPRVPGWLNRTLLGCAAMERALLLRAGLPLGLSIAGVFRHAAPCPDRESAREAVQHAARSEPPAAARDAGLGGLAGVQRGGRAAATDAGA
jgi:SAM-dependent methyltransferase